ncbi:hypothetical protein SAMN04488127_3093 [Bhargavaea ginsengi]|uniref:Uncharacterized protein n=1 Tax=Bhargavaea ginsengi TaxID=426757 RepID=A0A1H7C9S0_9BACL|nr:hypothetical protein SAMN04488127_3093 [Bhargavaea ginsengi]
MKDGDRHVLFMKVTIRRLKVTNRILNVMYRPLKVTNPLKLPPVTSSMKCRLGSLLNDN